MKEFSRLSGICLLIALVAFSMTVCSNDVSSEKESSPHLGNDLKINGQVWEGANTNLLSQAYSKFGGNRTVSVSILWPSAGKLSTIMPPELNTGRITGGQLDIAVGSLATEFLLDWSDLKKIFSEWENLAMQPVTKGNNIILQAYNESSKVYDGILNKEKMSGTQSSIMLESLLHVYVENDCRITGVHGRDGYKPGDSFYHTMKDLDLSLKKGWNTLCRSQSLTGTAGVENLAIEMKNPNDFRWAIRY